MSKLDFNDGYLPPIAFMPTVTEKVNYFVYEGDKIVKSGFIQGNSFTAAGMQYIAKVAALEVASSSKPLDHYEVTVTTASGQITLSSEIYDIAIDNSYNGTVSTETVTFETGGRYLKIEGVGGTDTYHEIDMDLTVGSGQKVKFFLEYTFTGLGDGQNTGSRPGGNGLVAGYVFDDGISDRMGLGYILITCSNDSTYMSASLASNMYRSGNTVYISGVRFNSTSNSDHLKDDRWWDRIKVMTTSNNLYFYGWANDQVGDEGGPWVLRNTGGETMTLQTDITFTFGS